MNYRLFRNWRADGPAILDALRTQYAYTERESDRATGWLWSARQIAQLSPTPWPAELQDLGNQLIAQLEEDTGTRFEAACFQAYLDGTGCGWHYDRDWDEQAVLSLGITRKFGLRNDDGEQFLELADGDMIFMPSGFQYGWEHCVPQEDVKGERCSIVFRAV